jgi:hypothetical protein
MRLFPTVNLVCTESVHNWFKMRQCLLDLGQKYMKRIFIYSSTFLGCYLFYLIVLLLNYFDLMQI